MTLSATYFHAHLNFLAAVTHALNSMPTVDGMYLHVELREEGTHRKIGEWSDEIASTDWYYSEVRSNDA